MTRMLYFIIMVSFLDTFIQLPIITPYALQLGASNLLAGGIVAIYSLTNMIGNIIGGHWIDRFGRKRMLFLGMLAASIILLLYPLATTGEQLFFIRFLHGLAGGVLIPAAFAYVGDQTSKRSRGKAMAITGACIGTAAIIGPAIGGIMAARSEVEYVFVLVAVLFFITTLLLLKFVKESFSETERSAVSIKHFMPLLKDPLLLQASLAAFALMISNGTLAFALPLKVADMGLDSETTGLLLSTFGIVALIVFLTPLNRMYDRFEPITLVVIGLCLIASVHIMLNFTVNSTIGYLLMCVYGVGFAFVFPSMNKIVADASSKIDRGKAYGIFYAFFSLGAVAGSFISGAAAEIIGLPFSSSATIMLSIGLFLLYFSRKTKRKL
ncbi:MFS transporter [Sporosarcina sp. Marseille-Q4063]|uniref:MFS transporter n=1 Tax=Sporosarcina sp. Marseille-Q4063 TaxID=2810514 RepID=UPI001BAE607F|nr:MFS transporter [Sporosarcina sp. Marseille-Q4063]QUW21934.1 MFS transporter [Sporosarcina sp. Marseille-Q4063]